MTNRCSALIDDKTTPSGLTQCADHQDHMGDHWHVNVQRWVRWTVDGVTQWGWSDPT